MNASMLPNHYKRTRRQHYIARKVGTVKADIRQQQIAQLVGDTFTGAYLDAIHPCRAKVKQDLIRFDI